MADGPAEPGAMTTDALMRQLESVTAERDEAQAREAALSEILTAINASSGDFRPVFDLIIDKAMALCDAAFGGLIAVEGKFVRALADRNASPAFNEFWKTPRRTSHVLPGLDALHIVDVGETEGYRKRLPVSVAAVAEGVRTLLLQPMLSERGLIGIFALYRTEVRPFTDKQIALVGMFAAQAVTAMENARLIAEQRESLEQQTATAEILRDLPVADRCATGARRRRRGGRSLLRCNRCRDRPAGRRRVPAGGPKRSPRHGTRAP